MAPSDHPSELPSLLPSSEPTQAPTFLFFNDRIELENALLTADFSNSPFGPIEQWDVSRVEDFSGLFPTDFDENIADWYEACCAQESAKLDSIHIQPLTTFFSTFRDTSSVTTMAFAFFDNTSFNRDISGWNVGSVTSFNSM